MALNDSGDLIIECLEQELDTLFNEFEQLEGCGPHMHLEYQRMMNVRDKWADVAHKLINLDIELEISHKIRKQSLKLNCDVFV